MEEKNFNYNEVVDILNKAIRMLSDMEQAAAIIAKAFPDITTKDTMLHLLDNFYGDGVSFLNNLKPEQKEVLLKTIVLEITYQVPSIDINNVIVQL